MATVPVTDSCDVLNCQPDALVCHRCGSPGARERLIAKPIGTWSVAGVQPKVVARWTHGCDACIQEWVHLAS
jgi:hypothetical protein